MRWGVRGSLEILEEPQVLQGGGMGTYVTVTGDTGWGAKCLVMVPLPLSTARLGPLVAVPASRYLSTPTYLLHPLLAR